MGLIDKLKSFLSFGRKKRKPGHQEVLENNTQLRNRLKEAHSDTNRLIQKILAKAEKEELGKKEAAQMKKRTENTLQEQSDLIEEWKKNERRVFQPSRETSLVDKLKKRIWKKEARQEELLERNFHIRHDLRNRQQLTRGWLDILMEKAEKGELDSKEAGRIKEKINLFLGHQEGLLEQWEMNEQLRQKPFQELDLKELIQETMSAHQQKNIDFQLSAEEGASAEMPGDRTYLKSVFDNLISNAHEANADTVKVIMERNNDKTLEVKVKDNGQGFPEKQRPEEFFKSGTTTKKTGGEHGLGLASVKRIVKEHKGRISIPETGREGTTFHISFDLKKLRKEHEKRKKERARRPRKELRK